MPQAAPLKGGAGRGSPSGEQLTQVNHAHGGRKVDISISVVTGTPAAEQEIVLGMKVAGRLAEAEPCPRSIVWTGNGR